MMRQAGGEYLPLKHLATKHFSFTLWATGTHPALFVCCLYELKLKLQ